LAKATPHFQQRVLVLDTQPVWLCAIEDILAEGGFQVMSTMWTEDALRTLRRWKTPVFLIGIDGLADWEQVVNRARRMQAPTKLVVIAGDEDRLAVERTIQAGADAYVTKRAQAEDILFVVRQVLSPEVYEARPTIENATKTRGASRQRPGGLTRREHEILRMVAQGSSNAEIAKKLGIREPTVKGHLWRLYRKIGVPNRTTAARWVARSQLLDPE
jgi:DNA-binding NarL/FixJ family response regulator